MQMVSAGKHPHHRPLGFPQIRFNQIWTHKDCKGRSQQEQESIIIFKTSAIKTISYRTENKNDMENVWSKRWTRKMSKLWDLRKWPVRFLRVEQNFQKRKAIIVELKTKKIPWGQNLHIQDPSGLRPMYLFSPGCSALTFIKFFIKTLDFYSEWCRSCCRVLDGGVMISLKLGFKKIIGFRAVPANPHNLAPYLCTCAHP